MSLFKIRLFCLLLAAPLLEACAPTNAFKEPSDRDVHAQLICQDGDSALSQAQAVYPLEINGRSVFGPSKWSFKKFNLAPGETTILAKAPISAAVTASGFVKFQAVEGQRYYLKMKNQIEDVLIYVDDENGKTLSSVAAKKTAEQQQGQMIPIIIPTK